jgi:hypothetical protein
MIISAETKMGIQDVNNASHQQLHWHLNTPYDKV